MSTENRDYGDEGVITCPACLGSGFLIALDPTKYNMVTEVICRVCKGEKEIPENLVLEGEDEVYRRRHER